MLCDTDNETITQIFHDCLCLLAVCILHLSKNESSEPGPCIMCQTPFSKRKAITVASDSASAVASVPATKPLPVCKPKKHPDLGSIVLDVVGIASSDRGFCCEVHKNMLPMAVAMFLTRICSSASGRSVFW